MYVSDVAKTAQARAIWQSIAAAVGRIRWSLLLSPEYLSRVGRLVYIASEEDFSMVQQLTKAEFSQRLLRPRSRLEAIGAGEVCLHLASDENGVFFAAYAVDDDGAVGDDVWSKIELVEFGGAIDAAIESAKRVAAESGIRFVVV